MLVGMAFLRIWNLVHYRETQFNWSSDVQATVKYMFFFGYFLGHMPGGWFADKIGARHVTGTAVLLAGLANIAIPTAILKGGKKVGLYLCYTLRFFIGLVQGVIVPTISTFMNAWVPKKERALLGGIAFGGGNLGHIVVSIATGFIVNLAGSWAMPFYVWAASAIIFYVFFLLTSFSYPETHPFISEEEKTYLIEHTARKSSKFSVPWKSIMTSCPVMAIFMAQFGHNYVLFMMNTDLPKFVKDYLKFDIKSNGVISASPFIACWISALTSGLASDFLIQKNYMSVLN